MNAALPFIAAAALLALVLGFLASRGKDMNLEQWADAASARFQSHGYRLLETAETCRSFTDC